jgi:hypothetical protein
MSTVTPSPEAAILTRLLQPKRPTLSAEAARAILAIEFPAEDRQRMDVLAAKARAGTLTPAEEAEIDGYERVGLFLSLMKSKARRSLRAAGAG